MALLLASLSRNKKAATGLAEELPQAQMHRSGCPREAAVPTVEAAIDGDSECGNVRLTSIR